MALDFKSFKKNSSNVNTIVLEKNQKKDYSDGSWKVDIDEETGVGTATIRLLPPKDTELPYVTYYNHFFKGDDGRWCIVDRCPRTFGESCPICETARELYNGNSQEKHRSGEIRGRVNYVYNILVVNDQLHPENNGHVFPWKCGKQIHQMIIDSMSSTFGEAPKNPFDLENGNNFTIRVKKDPNKQNIPQYDRSSFSETPTPVATSDAELERIFNEMVDLNEFVKKGRISQLDIESKARTALSNSANARISKSVTPITPVSAPVATAVAEPAPAVTPKPTTVAPSESFSGSDESDLAWFAELANQ